jgi:hypothetical protein
MVDVKKVKEPPSREIKRKGRVSFYSGNSEFQLNDIDHQNSIKVVSPHHKKNLM